MMEIKINTGDHRGISGTNQVSLSSFLKRVCSFASGSGSINWIPPFELLKEIVAAGRLVGPGATLQWKGFELQLQNYLDFVAEPGPAYKVCPPEVDELEKWAAWRRVGGDRDSYSKYILLQQRLRQVEAMLEREGSNMSEQMFKLMGEAISIQEAQREIVDARRGV